MSRTSLSTLPSNTFSLYTKLSFLSIIDHSMYDGVAPNALSGLSNLEHLDFSSNNITYLPDNLLQSCLQLRLVNFRNNILSTVPKLSGLTLLGQLDIGENAVDTLPNDYFSSTPKLTHLLADNNLLDNLPAGLFNGLSKLENVDLSNNRLSVLHSSLFDPLVSVDTIDLSHNLLTTIGPKQFAGEIYFTLLCSMFF